MQKKDIDLLYGGWDWSPDPNKYNFINNKHQYYYYKDKFTIIRYIPEYRYL